MLHVLNAHHFYCVCCNFCTSGQLVSLRDPLIFILRRDLGAHIDGFIVVAAHSLLLQGDAKTPVEGQAADVLQATNTALEAALRLVRPGKLVSEVQTLSKPFLLCHDASGVLQFCSHLQLLKLMMQC